MATALSQYLSTLTVTQGDHAGQPFKVLPWEARFLKGAFAVPGPAALSVARGNGKSALVAGIAAAVVDPDGPLHGQRLEVVCVAAAFSQSKIIFEDVLCFLRERHDIYARKHWRLQDSANVATVEHRASGCRVRCIGGDPAKAHGLRPALALLDEPAQWDRAKRDKMLAAIRTSLGKVPGSKMLSLGTRAADPEHWFSKMLAGGAAYAQCHAARLEDPPFQVRTWKRANPSLDHMPGILEEIREHAADAKTDPALLPSFRALRLNQGVEDVEISMLLDAATWQRIEDDAAGARGEYVLGLDLGDGSAMSGAAAYWPLTGRLEAIAAFPEIPDVKSRGLADGVGRLYLDLHKRNELMVTPGYAVGVDLLLDEVQRRWGLPEAIVSDTWRERDVRAWLDSVSFPQTDYVVRRQGFGDGAEDVRGFRRACLTGRVKPGKSLLLRAALSEARVIGDPAGNEKLAKGVEGGRRRRARDDAAAACLIAVAEGSRRWAGGAAGGGVEAEAIAFF